MVACKYYEPDSYEIENLKKLGFNFTEVKDGYYIGNLERETVIKELTEVEILKLIKEIGSEVVLAFTEDVLELEIYNDYRE